MNAFKNHPRIIRGITTIPVKETDILPRYEEGGIVDTEQTDEVVEAPNVSKHESNNDIEPEKVIERIVFDGAPVSFRNFMKANGTDRIDAITVYREPIKSYVDSALQLLSLGQWNKAKKKAQYDKMFHLYMVVSLEGKSDVYIEKNQTLKGGRFSNPGANAEKMVVSLKGKDLYLQDMLEQALNRYGDKAIYHYDPFSYNCQIFVNHMLAASGLLTKSLRTFIYQPIDKILATMPKPVRRISKRITNMASIVDKLVQKLTGGFIRLKDGGIV